MWMDSIKGNQDWSSRMIKKDGKVRIECPDREPITMKDIWWMHLIYDCVLPKSFTTKRLEKIKSKIMEDKSFWNEVLFHYDSGYACYPEYMKKMHPNGYDHCIANMIGIISIKLAGKIKPARKNKNVQK